jgi:hypothetical protein
LKIKVSFSTASMVLAAIILLEGMAIAANARQINSIQSLNNGLFQSTVALAGVQLLVLGLVAFLAFALPKYVFKDNGNAKLNKLLSWLPLLAGIVVLAEGIVVVLYASRMDISGIGFIRGMWAAGFGAQLFVLSVGLVLFKMFSERESVKVLLRLALFVTLGAIGLFVVGVAGETFITGIGLIHTQTLRIAGFQLLALSMVGIVLMYMEGWAFMRKKMFGHRLGALSVIAVAVLICLEGLILAGFAAPFSVDGIGNMMERTMMIAGLVLAILGLLVPATYYFFEEGDYEVKRIASNACLFLIFILPFALLI